MSGGNRELVPPDPIPNSEVKRLIADDSVGSPHVKVGHCQTLIQKTPITFRWLGFFLYTSDSQIVSFSSKGHVTKLQEAFLNVRSTARRVSPMDGANKVGHLMIKLIFLRFLLRKFFIALSIPLVALFIAVGLDFSTYQALTDQQHIFKLKVKQLDENLFDIELVTDDYRMTYPLSGDQWQLDFRLIRFTPAVALTGLSNLYQPSRLSSRYIDITDQQTQPLNFHSLRDFQTIDSWKYLKRYDSVLPFIESVYGSSVYMPLADGAEYEILIGFSGLVVKSLNYYAKAAVHSWH